MKASGVEASETEWESKLGLMVLSTREIGKTIELTVMENLLTSMVMFMKATGSMTRPTGTASTHMSTARATKVIGSMIYSMVRAKKAGLTVPFTKVNTLLERNMAGECTDGMMEASTKENGLRIK